MTDNPQTQTANLHDEDRHNRGRCPISIQIHHDLESNVSQEEEESLPASYRTPGDDICTFSGIDEILELELHLDRMDQVSSLLWTAGRLMPPRSLHHQRVMGRDYILSESLDMHLVWPTGRLYLKPLPLYLLKRDFWVDSLHCDPQCDLRNPRETQEGLVDERCRRRKVALGFLFSWVALIQHESDLQIAQEKFLIPKGVTWSFWRRLSKDILDNPNLYNLIDFRFWYGELRLSRLDKAYYLWRTPGVFYLPRWDRYVHFLGGSFAYIAVSTVYTVLTAMQLGHLTGLLQDDHIFDSVSGRFALFATLAPQGVIIAIMTVFAIVFIINCSFTSSFRKKRLESIKQRSKLSID